MEVIRVDDNVFEVKIMLSSNTIITQLVTLTELKLLHSEIGLVLGRKLVPMEEEQT